ncbi:carbohydrate sulfotransferase 11-like [Oratosquilla oratoria]|uniref:carbohydrate sulfotransferase 11-like n=1 Tax=Oratosquilla oratoria TaxID=337810 RepID=UPI003F75DF5A
MFFRIFVLLISSLLACILFSSQTTPVLRHLSAPGVAVAEGYRTIANASSGLLQNHLNFGGKEQEEEEKEAGRYQIIQGNSLDTEEAKQDSDDIETFMKTREKEYERRRSHLQKACAAYGETLRFGQYENLPLHRLRWLNPRKLIICFNAKVGTTTWSKTLLSIKYPDISTNRKLHAIAGDTLIPPYPPKSEKARELMESYTKLITVRDPFARIVSAYKDKIGSRIAKRVIRKMKNALHLKRDPFEKEVPFEMFVEFIVRMTSAENDVREKTKHFTNVHWRPYYANCGVCDIDYAIIAKTESVYDDMRYVIHRFGLNVSDPVPINKSKVSSEEEALAFFKALPRNLTLALYERFRPDFELFGYSVDKYLAGK